MKKVTQGVTMSLSGSNQTIAVQEINKLIDLYHLGLEKVTLEDDLGVVALRILEKVLPVLLKEK